MICRDTLVIKNLPPELSDAEKEELLVHFGAKTVKMISSKKDSKAFAKFENEEYAKNVMKRLHQINVLGSILSVEYAKQEIGCDKVQINYSKNCDKNFTLFLNKLNSWNSNVNFTQPPPPHLKYAYPKANVATINNIAHALATVPKFYTQVLHLMNRMNLPPPFSNIPDPPAIIQKGPPLEKGQQKFEEIPPEKSTSTESESEFESDPDEIDTKIKEIIPEKRKKAQKKVIKKPKFIKPQTTNVANKNVVQPQPQDVFETIQLQTAKRIELKVSENLDVKEETVSNVLNEEFGIMHKQLKAKETVASDVKTNESVELVTDEELSSNRISPRDFGVVPIFKDYHPGVPSCRVYIKNLSKNVVLKDLEKIYKRYDCGEVEGNMFDIRLMQEGRMKGQAFITLQNVALAQRAVKETNGYILKNKPLVVVFARSAIPKNKST